MNKKMNNCNCEISQNKCRFFGTCLPFSKLCMRYPDGGPSKGQQCVAMLYRLSRGNVPDFGRMSLTLKYTDLTRNTYIRS